MNFQLSNELKDKIHKKAKLAGLKEDALIEHIIKQYFSQDSEPNSVYISTPLNALVEGLYQENMTIGDLKKHGDFGLGTFNELDGEMVMLNGVVYQLKSDGKVYEVKDDVKTPFACVTFFMPHTKEVINEKMDYSRFNKFISSIIPSPNIFYAILLYGKFEHIKTRSVPKQRNYVPLINAAEHQKIFEYKNITGVINGFYTPPFMESIHVAGYHLHFIDDQRTCGGHLLECTIKEVNLSLQFIQKMELGLPITMDYLTTDLTRNTKDDVERIEK